jgi:uncharacterized cupredoxin-like copper-binding protein
MSRSRVIAMVLAATAAATAALIDAASASSASAFSASALSASSFSATAAIKPPARMLVYAQEWSLWPSRGSLPAGRVIVQLWNRGQDAHNLRIRRLDSHGQMVGPAEAVPVTQSGKLSEARWRLGRGRYELYCSMPGHLKNGMHATLRVR